MKVLVIGGCGFIGSHVVDMLLEQGHGVRVLDRRHEAFRDPLPPVDYRLGDCAEPFEMLEALEGIDAVIQAAGASVPSTSNIDPEADILGNLIPTLRLLDLMRQQGIGRMVYLSSGGAVYGVTRTDPVSEDHPQQPISSYGIVKGAVEKYLYMEEALHGLKTVVLRPSNPYGPRQGHTGIQGVIGTWLWRISRGEPVEIWGDGSVVRDFIHVRDLARLCVRALVSGQSGVFNAGAGQGTSINEVLASVRRATGLPIQPVYRKGRDYDVPRIVLDIARARAAFDWSPETPLEDGLAETWDWIRSREA